MLVSLQLFAVSFSLQVVQKNTNENDVYGPSYVMEQAILDYFYDRGCIVSNGAVIIFQNEETLAEELKKSFCEAHAGGLDVIVNLSVIYNIENSTNPSGILLSNIKEIQWEALSLSSGKVIGQGKSNPGEVSKDNNNYKGIEAFAKTVAKNIQEQLSQKGGVR